MALRTAEEYLKEMESLGQIDGYDFSVIIFNDAVRAINEARKEAIEEIAEAVNYPYRDEYGCHCDVPSIVNQFLTQIK